jgi:DNA topoisomerase-1
MNSNTLDNPAQLQTLFTNTRRCAELVGLVYGSDDTPGYARRKRGKGFSFLDEDGHPVTDKEIKRRLTGLVIPPAWQEVWICPEPSGHILATGVDDRGRKQYIYHPKWRTMRDLLKFYRMILFGLSLPAIRAVITKNLTSKVLSSEQVIAAMLWILDNTYIRVGNDIYFEQNQSIGLTTLTDHNVIIAGPVVTLAFTGKSGKQQQLVIEDPLIAEIIAKCRALKGERLFQYKRNGEIHAITARDINAYLQQVSEQSISTKDFRTWGGTLLAFDHLIRKQTRSQKPDKAVIEAVDTAANILGNTRAIAKASYIHPHLLKTYGTKHFDRYYAEAQRTRTPEGLDRREGELLRFLELLFEHEFSSLEPTRA